MAELMRLTDILQTVTGSVDFGSVDNYRGDTEDEKRTNFWMDVIATKAGDTGFGHLVESILRKGFDENAPIGWYGTEITEGHHRLVGAILLCLDEIWVDSWGGNAIHTHPDNRNHFSAHMCASDPYPIEIEGYERNHTYDCCSACG